MACCAWLLIACTPVFPSPSTGRPPTPLPTTPARRPAVAVTPMPIPSPATTSQEPSPWAGPRGDLVVTVVYPSGEPAEGRCLLGSTDLEVEEVDPIVDGRCSYHDIAAVKWSLRVDYQDGGDTGTVIRDFF